MAADFAVESALERPLAAGRKILWIGFGSILLLMLLIGVEVTRSLQDSSSRNAALMKSFRSRDQVLDELRNNMIRSGAMIRDYLSEPDAAKAEQERTDLQAVRHQTAQLLADYERREEVLDAQQQRLLADLKSGVEAYWKSISPPLRWDPATRKSKGEAYRREAIGPLRAEVLRLSREITVLNERQLDAGEQAIQAEQTRLRSRLIFASSLGIVISAALAVFVNLRNRKLEQAAERQYRKVTQARRELRDLAGRLEAAQEEERKRLSRELHDEVGQSMSALLMDLGRLESMLPPEDHAARKQLAIVRGMADSSVKSVRNMALLLRPSMLDDLGLAAALKWQGRELARRTNLKVTVDADEATDELPDSHRTCIYRVVQEALNNAAHHAKASAVRVSVCKEQDRLEVRVQDNGSGFNTSEKGVGLLGMEERVARLGGVLRLESQKGGGTILAVSLPASETGELVS